MKIFQYSGTFVLESGRAINHLKLAYHTFGEMNESGDNVVWVFHALTANSNPQEWWNGLVGPDKVFDPQTYFIVCVNMPGSPYGSTSPLQVAPETGKPYYHHFPLFTTRDMIRSYAALRTYLGIKKIAVALGGSMGGQQLMEWAIEEPELFEAIIPIATNARHSPWGIAFNATQRMAIESDCSWKNENEKAGLEGMKTARAIALLSYRNYQTYEATQTGWHQQINTREQAVTKAETYQAYQGEKLAQRFNAFSYYFLSKGMDSHDVGRNRGSVEEALKKIQAKCLVIGITTDLLFPITEQKYLAQVIPNASFVAIESLYGHDGFLLEFTQISYWIHSFLNDPLFTKRD